MISTLWKTCGVCAIFTLLTSLRIQPPAEIAGRTVHGREMPSGRGFPDGRGFPTATTTMLRNLLTTNNSCERKE
jgi:hypothetical protein